MKFVSNLKTSVKILLLVAYTLVLVLLSALSIKLFKSETKFEEYKYTAHDKNIEVSVVMMEKRTPSKTENKDSREEAKWNFRVTVSSLDTNANYKNVSTYLAVESESGKVLYSEKLSSNNKETTMTSTYLTNYQSVTGLASLKEVKNSTTGEFEVKDESPKYGYLTVVYEKKEVKENNEEEWVKNQLHYKFDVLKSASQDFSKYEKTTASSENGKYVVDLKDSNKIYKVSFKPNHTNENTQYDIVLNYSKETIGEAGINVEDSSIAIFAKVENDRNDTKNVISDYVQLLHVYGITTQRTTGISFTGSVISIPKEYKVSELYILVTLKTESGKTTQSKVRIDVSTFEN